MSSVTQTSYYSWGYCKRVIFSTENRLNSVFLPTKLISSSLNTSECDCRKGCPITVIQIMCHRAPTCIISLFVKCFIFNRRFAVKHCLTLRHYFSMFLCTDYIFICIDYNNIIYGCSLAKYNANDNTMS